MKTIDYNKYNKEIEQLIVKNNYDADLDLANLIASKADKVPSDKKQIQ